MLNKYKIYSFDDLKKDLSFVMKVIEFCFKYNLCYIKLCSERESVCCDFCLFFDYIDVCKGEYGNI